MEKTKLSIVLVFTVITFLGLFATASGFRGDKEDITYFPLKDNVHHLVWEDFEGKDEGHRASVIINILNNGEIPNDSESVEQVHSELNPKYSVIFDDFAIFAQLTEKEIRDISKNRNVHSIGLDIPLYPILQDSVNILNATGAWNLNSQGFNLDGSGTSVCVIDLGVDFNHPDLAGKDIVGGNIDCSQTAPNCNPVPMSNPSFQHAHGTRVAGALAANGGITGIGKGVNIISLYAESTSTPGTISASSANRAVRWCRDNAQTYNITAISMSFGSGIHGESCDGHPSFFNLGVLVGQIFDLHGVYTIAGAGNDNSNTGIGGPACLSKVIAVGATDKQDNRANIPGWWGSNYYAPLMKLFAPGVDINTTELGGGYHVSGGTSIATPMVASSVAIISKFMKVNNRQGLHYLEMEDLLFNTGEPINDLNPAEFRRINIYNAIESLDLGAPEINITSPMQGGEYNQSVMLNYEVTDELIDSCWYVLNGFNYQTKCGQSVSLNVTEGNNSLTVFAKDQLGKESNMTVNFTFNEPILSEPISLSLRYFICDPFWAC